MKIQHRDWRKMLIAESLIAILVATLNLTGVFASDLSIGYSQSSDQAIIVSFFDRHTEGTSLVGTLQIENISGTWVYIEQDTFSPNPVFMPYTIYLLGPGATKTFPNFTFPQGSYLKLTATTPLGLDFTQPSEKLTALQGALAVDLLTRGLLSFSLPPDAFDTPPFDAAKGVIEPLLDEIVSTISGVGHLMVAIRNRSFTDTLSAISDIASNSKDVERLLAAVLKKYVTTDQVHNALGVIAELLNLPEKVSLLTDLTARTFDSPFSTWSRLDVVAKTQAPSITSVLPSVLTTMPVPETQTLTIHGAGLTSSSSLVFKIGNATFASRPERLTCPDSNTLRYNIAVGSAVGTWTVTLAEGTGSATFRVDGGSSGSYIVTPLNGPHGSISPSAALTKAGGESQTFIAAPQDSTFSVDSWYVDGTVIPNAGNRFTLSDIQAPHTVFVTFKLTSTTAQTGSLTVTLQPAGAIAAGAQWQVDGGNYRNSGNTVPGLTPGLHTVSFKSVTGYTTPANRPVTITGGAVTPVTSTYTVITPSTYTLTLNQGGIMGYIVNQPFGSGSGNIYNAGAVVQLSANANYGYHFVGWGGDVSGTSNPITIVMNGNKSVTANFESGDPRLGTVIVTIQPPEAAAAGVKWGWNENDFRDSGTSVTSDPGTYLMTIHLTTGWSGNGVVQVTFTAGQTTYYEVSASSTTGSTVGIDPRTYYTLAGLAGNPGSIDSTGSDARFSHPWFTAVDRAGNVYVADYGNSTIRTITPAGAVRTLAGLAGSPGSTDGTGSAARFNMPIGVAVDSATNVYVGEYANNAIRKITPGGVVSTLAGLAGNTGSADGAGSAARFKNPGGVAVDNNGNVYVADYGNFTIRKITLGGAVSTLAGLAGNRGTADGIGTEARFFYPSGIAVDNSGNVYVSDLSNHTIRKITSDGTVTTLAGFPGSGGAADGTGNVARFSSPAGVAVDSSGNVYVADEGNSTIRKITSAGAVSTLAGLSGHIGSTDGNGSIVRFQFPTGVALDSTGNIFVADEGNSTIRTTRQVGKADQIITFALLPDKSAGDPPPAFALSATASSGLPVYFDIVSGPAVLDNNVVTLLGGGMVTVSAWQPGNSNYNAAATVQRSFNVVKLVQTISFGPLSRQTVGDAPFPLLASANSGLPVSFAVVSGPAALSGNIVTLTGWGTVVVRASQAGNAVYAAAANVNQAFYVVRGNNMITDAQRLADGQFSLVFGGEFGRPYVVEYSTNLEYWAPLATNVVNGLGVLELTDPSATNRSRSFYRVNAP